MSANDVLNILQKYQDRWLAIANNLLYREDEQSVKVLDIAEIIDQSSKD